MSARPPLIVSVPGALPTSPGLIAPPSATVTLPPIVPVPPSVAPLADSGQPGRARLVAVDEQRAGSDVGRAGIAVVAGQDRRAGADLVHDAAARDHAGEAVVAVQVEGERAVVDHVAVDQRAAVAAIADLQRPAPNRRAGAVAVIAGQRQRAGALLEQALEPVTLAPSSVRPAAVFTCSVSPAPVSPPVPALTPVPVNTAVSLSTSVSLPSPRFSVAAPVFERARQVDDVAAAAEVAVAAQRAAGWRC